MVDFDKGCEECGSEERLYNTITEGKAVQLCKRCAKANHSLVFQEKDFEEGKLTPKVTLTAKPKENFTFNDLYNRYREMKKKRSQEVSNEKDFVKDIEKKELADLDKIKLAIESPPNINFNSEETRKVKVRDLFSFVFGSKKNEKEKV